MGWMGKMSTMCPLLPLVVQSREWDEKGHTLWKDSLVLLDNCKLIATICCQANMKITCYRQHEENQL